MSVSESHATDGVLVALLDGEPAAGGVAGHVARCATCATRLDLLRHAGTQLANALPNQVPGFDASAMRARLLAAQAERRARPSVWASPMLRVAAGIILVAGVAWASPARAWLAVHLARTGPSSSVSPKATTTPAVAPTTTSAPGMIVRFAAVRDELLIAFAARPAAGVLEVQSAGDARVSARITARGASEEMMVLPGELRILNSATSAADYRVTLPPAVRRLRIVIAGEGERIVRITPSTRESIALGR